MAAVSSRPQSSPKPSHGAISDAILRLLGDVPESDEPAGDHPRERSLRLARSAARRAAALAGTLALPPGPLGWLTILPELVAVWRIQGRMVADIAAAHGKTAFLSREQMLYCLFRHAAAQAVRDVVVRAGERMLVRRASARMMEDVASRVSTRIAQRAAGEGLARWLPILGAAGVGAYAYWDTMQVAKTAVEFFGSDVEVEVER